MGSPSSNPSGGWFASALTRLREPPTCGGPLVSHCVRTCKLAQPAPSAIAPHRFRGELPRLSAPELPEALGASHSCRFSSVSGSTVSQRNDPPAAYHTTERITERHLGPSESEFGAFVEVSPQAATKRRT